MARVGITSTWDLIGVVSLPRVFVFRMGLDDPHPIPWIRVKISSAIGAALYPHQQVGPRRRSFGSRTTQLPVSTTRSESCWRFWNRYSGADFGAHSSSAENAARPFSVRSARYRATHAGSAAALFVMWQKNRGRCTGPLRRWCSQP